MVPDDIFRPAADVRHEVDALAEEIRTSTPADGVPVVRLPGDRSSELLTRAQSAGIELSETAARLIGVS